jgi:hypothetical protein
VFHEGIQNAVKSSIQVIVRLKEGIVQRSQLIALVAVVIESNILQEAIESKFRR